MFGRLVGAHSIELMVRRQSSPTAIRVRAHRQRLREQGLRLIQIWVPDVRSPQFAEQAHRQSLAIASSRHEADAQAFPRRLGRRRVNSGEIWTAAAGSGYAGRPRPVVVVQDDRFDANARPTERRRHDQAVARARRVPRTRRDLTSPHTSRAAHQRHVVEAHEPASTDLPEWRPHRRHAIPLRPDRVPALFARAGIPWLAMPCLDLGPER